MAVSAARQLAFKTLFKIHTEQSYSNLAIAGALKNTPLQNADKAFFTALVYGVLERKLTLDYNLSQYLKQPIKKLNPKVYVILLLGAYQVLFMDKVPNHAAINESVELTKKNGVKFAANLTNAVLHKVLSSGLVFPAEPTSDSTEKDIQYYYSVKYSMPDYLVKLWTDSYGLENAIGIMKASLGAPPLWIRVNTTKTTTESLISRLKEEGVSAKPTPIIEDALELEGVSGVEHLTAYQEGLFHVQDLSSQLCCATLNPQPGEVVFDLCAAPGGKTFTMAERMQNQGKVVSFDLHEHRVKLISSGAERLGLSIVEARQGDAQVYNGSLGYADKVLCDVPCAGFGIVGRKPEIRYKEGSLVDNLPPLQYDIFNNAAQYVRPGGSLVYSTCSLNPAENEEVVHQFLESHEDWSLSSMETLFPHTNHTDGFFIASLRKKDQ